MIFSLFLKRISFWNLIPRKNTFAKSFWLRHIITGAIVTNLSLADKGHLDILANMQCVIDHADSDSIHAVLTSANITDRASGLDVRNLTFQVAKNKQNIYLNDVEIQLPQTRLAFSTAQLRLKPLGKSGS